MKPAEVGARHAHRHLLHHAETIGELDRRVSVFEAALPGEVVTPWLAAGHACRKHPRIRATPRSSVRTLRHESTTRMGGKIAALEAGRPIASIAGVVDVKQGY